MGGATALVGVERLYADGSRGRRCPFVGEGFRALGEVVERDGICPREIGGRLRADSSFSCDASSSSPRARTKIKIMRARKKH